MNSTLLKNVSLCAIVRDEKMNPAGGIERFLEAHLPFVEAAVVVDTGSIDGTREILEGLETKYPHLRVIDTNFVDFAQARNVALSKVKTEKALVLDADELIIPYFFTRINHLLQVYPEIPGFNFKFVDIFSDCGFHLSFGHNPRLFKVDPTLSYIHGVGEVLTYKKDHQLVSAEDLALDTKIPIYHFKPSERGAELKQDVWYGYADKSIPPSQTEGFSSWKAFNPKRNQRRFN